MRGQNVKCARCNGHGLISVWSFGVKEPDECADCGGSGLNWRYPNGTVARFYGGPFLGRETPNLPLHGDKHGNRS